LKIIGPDLDELEKLAALARPRLQAVTGVRHVRILPVKGVKHLEFGVDREKCSRWGISVAEVQNVLSSALDGKTMSSMIEGARQFDITVRWPARLRRGEQSILDIPLDVINNEPIANPDNPIGNKPRLRLRDVVSPLGKDGEPDPEGAFMRMAAAAIYREQGQRLILLRLGVRGRGQAAVRAEAEQTIAPMLTANYRLDWDCSR
jgi:heavy metal efflux system protein